MRTQNAFGRGLQILLFVIAAVALIMVFKSIIPSQPLAPQPTDKATSPGYPPPDKQTTTEPYPPPVGTRPSPVVMSTTAVWDPLATRTPRPLTPLPTLTLPPGPSPTPIPLRSPAADASGEIVFAASTGTEDHSTYYSLNVGRTGMKISQAVELSNVTIIDKGFVWPSPDGNRLAFVGPWGALQIFNLDKNSFDNLSPDISPISTFLNWFPDNRRIITVGGSLSIIDPVSGERSRFLAAGYGDIIGAAASPDGTMIVFSFNNNGIHEPGLYVVDSDGQNSHLLVKGPSEIRNISWSPDGKRIAFWGDGWEIFDVDTGNIRQIAQGTIIPQCYFLPPLWSPDSRTIAVVSAENEQAFCYSWADTFKGSNIVLIDVGSGKARPLLSDGSTGNIDPAWSPDGSQIVFVSNRSGSADVWTVNVDGSNLQSLDVNVPLVRFPYWRRTES